MTMEKKEEIFSDFNFAPSNHAVNSNSTMINGSDFTNTNDADADDDWGDFNFVSSNSSGFSHTLSLPKISTTHFEFSTKNQNSAESLTQPGSAPSRVNNSAQWKKPNGALPLSLFGEIEEEEEEEEGSGAGEPPKNESVHFSKNKEGSGGVNVIDLIANLYKEKERNNGFGSGFNGSDMNWENLNGNGLNVNGVNKDEMNSKGLDLDLKENGLNQNKTESNLVKKDKNFSGNGVDLGLVNGNEPFDVNGGGGGGDDDDDGWEFKGADSITDSEVDISKASEMKAENGLVCNVNGLNSRWNPLSLDLNGWTSHVNRDDSSWDWLNTGTVDGNTAPGNSDDWEFKETGSRMQAEDEKEKGEQMKAEIKPILSFDGSNSTWNSLSFDGSNSTWNSLSLDGLKNSNLNEVNSDRKQMNLNSSDENEDFDGNDEWEFKAAESESGTGDKNTKGDERKVENPEGTTHALGFGSGVIGTGDLFGASQQTSKKSTGRDFGFDFSTSLAQDTKMFHTHTKNEQNDTKKVPHSSPDDGVDSDEESWEFKDAFSETRSKEKEEPKVVEVSAAVEAFPFDGEIKGNMARSISHKGALPLSIFGDEEQDSNDPVSYQDISPQLSSSKPIDGVKSPHLNISINDLISSLYSQAEHDTGQNPSGSGLSPANVVIESNLAGDSDDFDDDSWEFKDASSGIRAEDQASFIGLGEPNTKYSTKIELNDYVDFFCKLKEELHFLALCHLDNLKKAQSAASEDAEVKALVKEIQNLHDELQQDGLFSGEVDTGNHSPRKLCLNAFVEVLQEPKFQVFESEYQLTSKLSLVENDLGLTMELLKHVTSTIKILMLVSRKEQSSYVSTWSEILSVCARELKHGALIWTQSLQKDVHDQILSKPQGKNYIVALGEIYRVVEVIGSSARLYKPWLLVSSTNPMGLLTLLSECFTIWSSSGLEEALQSISDPAGLYYNGGLTTLIESIKHIHDLDTRTLYNHVFCGQGPICQLSVLTAGIVPGMKTVVWNGEHYFLTLANLWANLVSCNPPNLPHIHVG
uniref:Synergin gamma C-terminal domain-containing protein n=1 Tax=Populus trichocarpa TaxID=3694 RepID=A0A2K1XZW4_POPTR|eukprot:XP_024439475.1 dentin sialophosphoprotein isoform X1 [Populus trichocarpa]